MKIRQLDPYKVIATVIMVLFVISLIPILYVGLYTYPTGDDFWYGKYVAQAWREHHSILSCIKAAFTTIKEFYYTWQGTWYSIFLFCFNPEMLFNRGYVLVPFLAITLLGGGFYLLMYQVMLRTLKLRKCMLWICFCVTIFQMLQYMPRTTSGIYWYNGIIHYNSCTFVAMVAIAMMIIFVRDGKKYAYILAIIAMILIGGGNYQAAILPLMFWVFLLIGSFFNFERPAKVGERLKKLMHAKRIWLLGIGILLELVGLAISGTAPGNSVRSEEFVISLKWMLQSIYYSIDRGIYLVRDDFYLKYPSMLLFIIFLAVILWFAMWNNQDKIKFRFPVPVFFVLFMCGIYWAMYTPGIFSKSDVSGGVPNTVQQIFLITSLANVIYVIGYIQRVLREKTKISIRENKLVLWIALIGILISGAYGYGSSTDKLCNEIIGNGHAKVYQIVREEQFRILKDPTITDAVIPELFDYDYYPICHLTVGGNAYEELNRDLAIYYGKNSVVAYNFREWDATLD